MFANEVAQGVYGKFRYPQKHIFGLADKPAVSYEIAGSTNSNVKEGVIDLPEPILDNLYGLMLELNKGFCQDGLYTGERKVANNCARFVNKVCGVEFDERLLSDTSEYSGWQIKRMPEGYEPEIGEVMVYKRLDSNRWRHWGIGVGGDVAGVLSLPSANAHWLTVASSSDTAKGYGHLEQYSATHPQSVI